MLLENCNRGYVFLYTQDCPECVITIASKSAVENDSKNCTWHSFCSRVHTFKGYRTSRYQTRKRTLQRKWSIQDMRFRKQYFRCNCWFIPGHQSCQQRKSTPRLVIYLKNHHPTISIALATWSLLRFRNRTPGRRIRTRSHVLHVMF